MEITIVIDSDSGVSSILLMCDKFMPALKIKNSNNKDLVYYTNQLTRQLLEEKAKGDTPAAGEAKGLLDDLNDRKTYVLWIRLSEEPLKKGNTEIIKLLFRDNAPTEIKYPKSRMYSLPKFTDTWQLPSGSRHDMFYIVTVPDENIVDYKIEEISVAGEKIGILPGKRRTLTKEDGFHQDRFRHTISIRVPPVVEDVKFKVSYLVKPNSHETNFFIAAIIFLIGFSLSLSAFSMSYLEEDSPFYTLKEHANALFGGIITVSLAVIGYIKKPIMNTTRWWFLGPIAISIIGFLVQTGSNTGSECASC